MRFMSIFNIERKETLWSLATLPRSESEDCEGNWLAKRAAVSALVFCGLIELKDES